jgi:hypothetical protein
MLPCTLIVRAYFFVYGEDGFSQDIKRTAKGIKHNGRIALLPRIGETFRVRNTQSEDAMHEFTVKNVTHDMEDNYVGGYEIDLGSGFIMDNDAFNKGIARWEALGFVVTVEEKIDAT